MLNFLRQIGRNAISVADKFKDMNHLLSATSKEMAAMGIKPPLRKYILGSREWYSRGIIQNCPVPKRQKKYLVLKERVKRRRLEKLGLA